MDVLVCFAHRLIMKINGEVLRYRNYRKALLVIIGKLPLSTAVDWTGSHLLIALSGRRTRTVRMAVRFTVSSSSK